MTNVSKLSAVALATAFTYFCGQTASRAEPVLEWIRQLGTTEDEFYPSLALDGLGNVYVSGMTHGSLGGPNAGDTDSYLAKYDSIGTLQWTRQQSSSERDWPGRPLVNDLGGMSFPWSYREPTAGPPAHEYIIRDEYDANGTLLSTQQFEVSPGFGGGIVYRNGLTDLYRVEYRCCSLFAVGLEKYDLNGTLLWSRSLNGGSNSSYTSDQQLAFDGEGYVYLAGHTDGSVASANLGGQDGFLAKYDASGTQEWIRQLGTSSSDDSKAISVDGQGNVYVAGSTGGDLGGPNAGGADAFVAKYDASGTQEWIRQLGTSSGDVGNAISADGLGNVYVAGWTGGDLGGPNAGSSDAFVAKYDDTGALQWTWQWGTDEQDQVESVLASGQGNLYVAGDTSGDLGGPHAGGSDAFVTKFVDLPELVGDFDFDGDVDGADFLAWQRGASPTPHSLTDLADWQANFGLPVGSAQSGAIPEPISVSLCGLAAILLTAGRRFTAHAEPQES